MDQLYQHPWMYVIAAWGSGPLALGLVGVFQWWRDRKDKQREIDLKERREQMKDSDARDAAMDEIFLRLSRDQKDFIANLRSERDSLQKRNDELELENRRVTEKTWSAVLWGRDMRHAANNARMLYDAAALKSGFEPRNWEELPEWKN